MGEKNKKIAAIEIDASISGAENFLKKIFAVFKNAYVFLYCDFIENKIADARIFNIHPFLEKRQVLDDT